MVNQTSDEDVCPERAERFEGPLFPSDQDARPACPERKRGEERATKSIW